MLDVAVHVHWCPRCETSWECSDPFPECPLRGAVVVLDHCARPLPDDELD